MPTRDQPRAWLVGRLVLLGVGAAPLLVGAFSVLAESGGGLLLDWRRGSRRDRRGGTNAWVLLVEIQR